MTTKHKYRYYKHIRNYAEFKMFRTPHAFSSSKIDDVVYEMQYDTVGMFTYNEQFFFFEDETDVLIFRLKYGK